MYLFLETIFSADKYRIIHLNPFLDILNISEVVLYIGKMSLILLKHKYHLEGIYETIKIHVFKIKDDYII